MWNVQVFSSRGNPWKIEENRGTRTNWTKLLRSFFLNYRPIWESRWILVPCTHSPCTHQRIHPVRRSNNHQQSSQVLQSTWWKYFCKFEKAQQLCFKKQMVGADAIIQNIVSLVINPSLHIYFFSVRPLAINHLMKQSNKARVRVNPWLTGLHPNSKTWYW